MAHNNLGIALRDRGKLDEAIAEYRKAIELDPKNAVCPQQPRHRPAATRAVLDEAIAEYRKAIELDPKMPLPTTTSATPCGTRASLDEAIAEYRKAIELDPEIALAHNNLGVALRDKADVDEAIAAYRKAIELEPNLRRCLQRASPGCWPLVRRQVPRSQAGRRPGQESGRTGSEERVLRQYPWRGPLPGGRLESRDRGPGEVDGIQQGRRHQLDWFFLAMARWQLGEKDKAREWYDRAVQWMDKNQPNE